jgi:D-beta-D-heptose 7-phosphate kinase/D-beta-D-heptose 1-phosphate adenosyltransferase
VNEPDRSAGTQALLAHLDRFPARHVWVVGDVMLDEYLTGAVERVSPEAPVPVVRVRGSEHRLGGAANVARQIATLGARVTLAGIIGEDEAGKRILELCTAARIDSRAVISVSARQTTRKLRVLGHSQQLLRLDFEDAEQCAGELSVQMLGALGAAPPPDAIVLSDYAKGVLTQDTLAGIARVRGRVPMIADPKHRDFSRYRGATTLTPNLRELEAAAGRALDAADTAALTGAARELMARAGLDSMVITLGDRGMLVVPGSGPELAVPAIRRDVYDVTGAGDTAIAVLALSLAGGVPLTEAAELANAAAGVAVCQVGAVAVSAASIRDALISHPEGKLLSRHDLAARTATWRSEGKRIVFTNGCFDLLHAGHLALLGHAARLGDVLVLAINSDASVRRLKGPDRPLVAQAERAALLAALAYVDAVTIFDEDTPLETLQVVRPDVLVKGGDYQPAQVVGRELVEAGGGRVEIVQLMPDRSTSSLVERIRRSQ